jgi:hypothetical protein
MKMKLKYLIRIFSSLNASGSAYTADRLNLGLNVKATRRRKAAAMVAAGANRVVTDIVADSPARKTTYLGTARGYHTNGLLNGDTCCRIYSQPCPKPQNTITVVFKTFRSVEKLRTPLW